MTDSAITDQIQFLERVKFFTLAYFVIYSTERERKSLEKKTPLPPKPKNVIRCFAN